MLTLKYFPFFWKLFFHKGVPLCFKKSIFDDHATSYIFICPHLGLNWIRDEIASFGIKSICWVRKRMKAKMWIIIQYNSWSINCLQVTEIVSLEVYLFFFFFEVKPLSCFSVSLSFVAWKWMFVCINRVEGRKELEEAKKK